MSYADEDMFFAEAYHTGDDLWTDIPFKRHAQKLMLFIPKGSNVLDIGAGRGHMLRELGKFGFRVIGLESSEMLVVQGNSDLKNEQIDKELRFVQGNTLNMPFVEKSFEAVVDVGHLQHIPVDDFDTYVNETARVLKQDGLLFLAVLSKKTPRYFKWYPAIEQKNDYELEGVRYHFFTEEEISKMFGKYFEVVKIKGDAPFGKNDTMYLIALLRRK